MKFSRAITFLTVSWLFCISSSALGQTTSTWVNTDGGNWSEANNWDTGEVPGDPASPDTNVVVNLINGDLYRVFANVSAAIGELTIDSEDAIVHFSGSPVLNVENGINLVNGLIEFGFGATVNAGEINFNDHDPQISQTVTIQRANVRGDITMTNRQIDLTDGASTTGRFALRNNAVLRSFNASEPGDSTSLDDTFILLSNSSVLAQLNNQITVGADSKITGLGRVGTTDNADFINNGTIIASVAGEELSLAVGIGVRGSEDSLGKFVNHGTLRARNGGHLILETPFSSQFVAGEFINESSGRIVIEKDSIATLQNQWSNRGRIDVLRDGQLTLGGEFSTSDIRNVFAHNGSSVSVKGSWNNEGEALNLNQRSRNFAFDGASLTGGIVHARGEALRFGGTNNLSNTRFVGDIVLDNPGTLLNISGSTVIGDIVLDGAFLNISDSNIESTEMPMTADSTLVLIGEKWRADQEISGAGTVFINARNFDANQQFRNLGVINANDPENAMSLFASNGANSFFSNRGTIKSTNGGHLSIDTRSLFFNHPEGRIEVEQDSSMAFRLNQLFINAGTIELHENSTLMLDGIYRTGFLQSITSAPTSRVLLDGTLYLSRNEIFSLSENHVGNGVSIRGGSVDLSNTVPDNLGSLEVRNSNVMGDFEVSETSSILFQDQSAIHGNVLIDGGNLRTSFETTINGNVSILNGGHASLNTDLLDGDIVVDGSSSRLSVSGEQIANSATQIELKNGGQIDHGGTDIWIVIDEGGRITGDGTIDHESPIAQFFNRGTIEASSLNETLTFFTEARTLSTGVNNEGLLVAREGGNIHVNGHLRQRSQQASIVLDSGKVSAAETTLITTGEIRGNGTLEATGHFFNGGKINPGTGIGRLNFIGSVNAFNNPQVFTEADGEIELLLEFAGLGQGVPDGFDFISIDGNLNLGIGELFNLKVDVLDDVLLSELQGEQFSIISVSEGNEITGSFLNVLNGESLTTIDNRFAFDVHYGADSLFNPRDVTLTNFRPNFLAFSTSAVPEPTGMMLVVITSMLTASRRRRAA